MDLSDPVLERDALDLILHLAIPENPFKRDELPFLKSPGELREISPGIDAMPCPPPPIDGIFFVWATRLLLSDQIISRAPLPRDKDRTYLSRESPQPSSLLSPAAPPNAPARDMI